MYFVQHRQRFEVSQATLWAAISEEGGLENYHPFCRSNISFSWPGPGSVDQLTYLNGRAFQRDITHWKDGVGYDLVIRYKNLETEVSWEIESSDRGIYLRIKLVPRFLHRNPIIKFFVFSLYIRPQLKNYLRHIFAGLNFFLANGRKVVPNQFGKHPWFS